MTPKDHALGVLSACFFITLAGAQSHAAATPVLREVSVGKAMERELIDRFIAAYNKFDIDGMVAHLSPEVRFENYSAGKLTVATTGVAEFRSLAEQSKALFSERKQRIASMAFEGAVTTVTIQFRGRFAVDVPDGPRAGEVIELHGTSEYSFRGGNIAKIIDRS